MSQPIKADVLNVKRIYCYINGLINSFFCLKSFNAPGATFEYVLSRLHVHFNSSDTVTILAYTSDVVECAFC